MSASYPLRNVQALAELQGIGVFIGARLGQTGFTAVMQLKDAVEELIRCADVVVAHSSSEGQVLVRTADISNLRAALGRVGGAA